jgi:SAM-dependent methyltransferase
MRAGRLGAPAAFWDEYFRRRELDWGGRWTEPFLGPLRDAAVDTVLELGCGFGHDAARLAEAGYEVTALDFSAEAVGRGRERYGSTVEFVVHDLSEPLPFADASFDAVMANVSLHMFPLDTTRAVFAEVARVVRSTGLFLFHVNASDDRPLRAKRRPVARELEPDYVLEEAGQTVRFFSRDVLEELLAGWDMQLQHVEIGDDETGEPFKRVWRGMAQRR